MPDNSTDNSTDNPTTPAPQEPTTTEGQAAAQSGGSGPRSGGSSAGTRFAVLAVVIGLLVFWGYVLSNESQDFPDSPMIGKQAESFELESLQTGKTVRLSDYRGKYVVLNFWASWCTSCRTEAAELEAVHVLSQQQPEENVVVIGIAIQDDPQDAKGFNAKYGQSFTTLLDPPGEIAVRYGVLGIPETFVIGPDGVVRQKMIGALTKERILAALAEAGAQL